jgi:hypothetical protein
MFRYIALTIACILFASQTHANTININGKTIVTTGTSSVIITNNKVYVDGKDVTPDAKQITIQVNGDVKNLECDACSSISVKGSAGSVSTVSGNIEVTGNVTGNVGTTSGDINVRGGVSGSAKTVSGDIRH